MTMFTGYELMILIGGFMIALPLAVFLLCCVEDLIRYSSKKFLRICYLAIALLLIYLGVSK